MVANRAERRVLLVEDDVQIRQAVTTGLRRAGFDADTVGSAELALVELSQQLPDLLVLDVGLPGASGIELCAQLRTDNRAIPVLILSARDAVSDRVAGLEAGADDYLVKPFDLTELVARIDALLRRADGPTDAAAEAAQATIIGELRIDHARRTVIAGSTPVELTRREFDLLEALAANRGVVLTRVQLLESVWGYDFDVDTNVVDVFVGYLRKKLTAAGVPKLITTVRGVGFVFEEAT